jgi:predicted nucleotidyltransferase
MTTLTPGEVGAALEAALAEEPRIDAVSAYVFGSVAEGRAHRQSDVDVALLLVRAAHPRASDRFEARLRLSARLAGRLGRPVDVVILNDVAPGLGRHVVSRGSRVLRRDAEADHAFVRDVQLRAADLDPFLRRLRTVKLDALVRS